MREAVLHERRLELAMEGFRWFDLMRYGDDYSKLFEICDGVNIKGLGRPTTPTSRPAAR